MLSFAPRKYIEKLVVGNKHMFNEDPVPSNSLLPNNNHPEIDDSELLGTNNITKYKSVIGCL